MKRPGLFAKVIFMDMILNALVCFIALFMLSLTQINPKSKSDSEPVVETEGKYVVVMSWPDGSGDDVDLYVRDPAHRIAFFSSREAGLMHLEHDDLGSRNDTMSTETGEVRLDKNEERVILRGVIPGEYVVNVHMYTKHDTGPTPVTITLLRLRGTDAEIVKRERVLDRDGDERTAFRFTVATDGSVVRTSITDLPAPLVGKAPRREGGGIPFWRGGRP